MLDDVRRILFVELLGGLGDFVMSLPSVHALVHSYPEATLNVLTFLPNGELIETDPAISRVFHAVRGRAPEALKAVLRFQQYDLVVSDTCQGGVDALIKECGSRYRFLNVPASEQSDELVEKLLLQNLADAGIIGRTNGRNGPLLTVSQADQAWAAMWRERNLTDARRTVMLHPHASMAIKRWDAENFIGLGRALSEEGIGLVVVSGEEPPLARYIARQIGSAATVLPTTTLRQFAALASTADLFISVDTGPGRVAAAVGTPTVMLFGPTWPGLYGLPQPHVNLQSPFVCPYLNPTNFTEQPCCYSGICVFPDKRNCLDDISPQSAYSLVKRLLKT